MKNIKRKKDVEIRYYKFAYLYKFGGGGTKSIFLSKNSCGFYLSILMSLVVILFLNNFFGKEIFITTFLTIATISSITLIGLIVVSYSTIASVTDNDYLSNLLKSGIYQYTLFQLTWAGLFLFISAIFGIIILLLQNTNILIAIIAPPIGNVVFLAYIFFFIYGLSETFVVFFFALRQLAILNARKTTKLKNAWEDFEKKSS